MSRKYIEIESILEGELRSIQMKVIRTIWTEKTLNKISFRLKCFHFFHTPLQKGKLPNLSLIRAIFSENFFDTTICYCLWGIYYSNCFNTSNQRNFKNLQNSSKILILNNCSKILLLTKPFRYPQTKNSELLQNSCTTQNVPRYLY